MMFLPEDKWSPRYETQFYSIRLNKYTTLNRPPDIISKHHENDNDTLFGEENECSIFDFCNSHQKYPAVYYEIEVMSGSKTHTCLRRYSQFYYLCKKLDPSGEMGLKKSLPPKTNNPLLLFHQSKRDFDDDFLKERMDGLYAFLRGLLIRQECVNNPLIEQFLELTF